MPRLLGNGVIFQREKEIHIWGFCDAKTEVLIKLGNNSTKAVADANNRFDAYLPAMKAGGPYNLEVSDSVTKYVSHDVLIGDVFVMCGQSNMEFPMSRVRDTFPEEWNQNTNTELRVFKIKERYEFSGELADHETGDWLCIGPDMINECPAIGYFMCKLLNEKTGVPVGVINASLGGSPIESWMSRQMLKEYPSKLELADKYYDVEYVKSVLENNARINDTWRNILDERDLGVKEQWQNITDLSSMDKINLPAFFEETSLNGHIGSVWFFKEFEADDDFLNSDSMLWLGTLTDSDVTFVNGIEVGRIEYKYPPRRYKVDKSLLKKGKNIVTVRLRIETGVGRVTPGKKLALFTGDVRREMVDNNEQIVGARKIIDLSGEWLYRIGASMDKIEPVDFVNWKPTGLYNGMLYPCTNMNVAAFIFYQGESNTDESLEYYDKMTVTQVETLRKLWKDETLPYIYTRLPNFELNGYEKGFINKNETEWKRLKKVQSGITDLIPYSYMADTDGMGEDNDVHPQNKKAVAAEYVRIIIENDIVK